MSTDEDQEVAYSWIGPIMHLGNKVMGDAIDDLPEDGNKSASAISALQEALNDEERVIYYCETFSAQCNMSGLNNFFTDSIALFYYEVVSALETLGAQKTSQALKRCKELVFGDQEVPVNDEERLEEFTDPDRPDWDEVEEQLEQIEEEFEDEEKELFESRLFDYALACGADGKLPKPKG